MGDDSWRQKPAVMTKETVEAMVFRVAEHCHTHGLSSFSYCLHGGEPLLMQKNHLQHLVESAHAAMPSGCEAKFLMQTNGVLLTKEWCAHLLALGVKVGVSLDGGEEQNDRFRVDHQGQGSYAKVIAGLSNATQSGLDFGILSVIDIAASPEDTYRHLASLRPRSVDLLLPDATHDRPPVITGGIAKSYGAWLKRFFRCWIADPVPPFRVRRFDQILDTTLGLTPPLSDLNVRRNEIIVIETDGALEPIDTLKVCEPGLTASKFNLRTHSLDEAAEHPMIQTCFDARGPTCTTCSECAVVDFCGGGYFPHRYQNETGFNNPSIYCQDLYDVIREVQNWAVKQLPSNMTESLGLKAIV